MISSHTPPLHNCRLFLASIGSGTLQTIRIRSLAEFPPLSEPQVVFRWLEPTTFTCLFGSPICSHSGSLSISLLSIGCLLFCSISPPLFFFFSSLGYFFFLRQKCWIADATKASLAGLKKKEKRIDCVFSLVQQLTDFLSLATKTLR